MTPSYLNSEFSSFYGKDLKYTVRFDDGSELSDLYGVVMNPEDSTLYEEYHTERHIVPEIALYSDEPITEGMLYRQDGVTVFGIPRHGRDEPIAIYVSNPQLRYIGQNQEPYPDKHMFYVRNCGDVHAGQFYMPNKFLRILQFLISKTLNAEEMKEFYTMFPDWDETVSYYDYDIVSFDDDLYQKVPNPVASIAMVGPNVLGNPENDPGWSKLT